MRMIGALRHWRGRLAVRHTVLLAVLLLAFTGGLTCYNVVQSTYAIRQELDRHVSYLGRFGADLTAQDLKSLRLNELTATMHNFVSRSDIVYARLLDKYRR